VKRLVLVAVAAALVFGIGVALGEALHDNPRPGGTQSLTQQLQPLPIAPAARETVTVTVSNP
jgi:hypothetical protein